MRSGPTLGVRTIGQRYRVNLRWVPGHAGIRRNEATDETAGLAAALSQDRVPVNYNAARARLKQYPNREWAGSNRHSKHYQIVGPTRVKLEDRMNFSRKESVAMIRLRTGHSTMLRAYRHRIGLDDCRRRSTGGCDPPTDVVSGGGSGQTPSLRSELPNSEGGLHRCWPGAGVPEKTGESDALPPYGRQVPWPENEEEEALCSE